MRLATFVLTGNFLSILCMGVCPMQDMPLAPVSMQQHAHHQEQMMHDDMHHGTGEEQPCSRCDHEPKPVALQAPMQPDSGVIHHALVASFTLPLLAIHDSLLLTHWPAAGPPLVAPPFLTGTVVLRV